MFIDENHTIIRQLAYWLEKMKPFLVNIAIENFF